MKKVYDRILSIRGSLLTVMAKHVGLGELAKVKRASGQQTHGSVLQIDGEMVTIQAFEDTRGISTGDSVEFLGHSVRATCGESILGRRFSGTGAPIDIGPQVIGKEIEIGQPSFNPVKRIVPHQIVRTNIPMIDVFNCLVKSQKIPIFSIAGEPYNDLLMRIANQTDADIVIIGGMGLRYDDYQAFIDNAERSGSMEKNRYVYP